jgi:hypothetical protein
MGLKERSQQFAFIAAVCMQSGEFHSPTPGATDNRRSAAATGSCSDRNIGSKSAGSPPLPDDRTCSEGGLLCSHSSSYDRYRLWTQQQ